MHRLVWWRLVYNGYPESRSRSCHWLAAVQRSRFFPEDHSNKMNTFCFSWVLNRSTLWCDAATSHPHRISLMLRTCRRYCCIVLGTCMSFLVQFRVRTFHLPLPILDMYFGLKKFNIPGFSFWRLSPQPFFNELHIVLLPTPFTLLQPFFSWIPWVFHYKVDLVSIRWV